METNLHPPKGIEIALKEITEILNRYCAVTSTYCFGMNSTAHYWHSMVLTEVPRQQQQFHFYLLLITEKAENNTVANLMDLVRKESGEKYIVSLLNYEPRQIAVSNNHHKHFFRSIFKSGWLVSGNSFELAKLKLTDLPEIEYKSIVRYTESRLRIAGSFLENSSKNFKEPLTTAYMLHVCMEQLCLGLLYTYLHYHPKHFHIGYLLDLCSIFCDTPENIFPRKSGITNFLLEMLSTSYHDLRFKSQEQFNREDITLLYNSVLAFREEVELILQSRLIQLKSFD